MQSTANAPRWSGRRNAFSRASGAIPRRHGAVAAGVGRLRGIETEGQLAARVHKSSEPHRFLDAVLASLDRFSIRQLASIVWAFARAAADVRLELFFTLT